MSGVIAFVSGRLLFGHFAAANFGSFGLFGVPFLNRAIHGDNGLNLTLPNLHFTESFVYGICNPQLTSGSHTLLD